MWGTSGSGLSKVMVTFGVYLLLLPGLPNKPLSPLATLEYAFSSDDTAWPPSRGPNPPRSVTAGSPQEGLTPLRPPPQNLPLGFELPALGRSVARAFPTGLVPSASIRCTHVLAQGRGLGTNAITLGLKEQGERWQAASRLTCG